MIPMSKGERNVKKNISAMQKSRMRTGKLKCGRKSK